MLHHIQNLCHFVGDTSLVVKVLFHAHDHRMQSATGMPCLEDSILQHLAASNHWLFPFTVRKHSVSLELNIHHSFMFSTLVPCESAVTSGLCKKKLLWSKLTTTFSMWNKHNNLEGNLSGVSCSFSKTAVISKLGYVSSQPWALARFIIADVNSLLWRWPGNEWESRWLYSQQISHYCTSGHVLPGWSVINPVGPTAKEDLMTVLLASLHSTFWYYEDWPAAGKLPCQFLFDFSMLYHYRMLYPKMKTKPLQLNESWLRLFLVDAHYFLKGDLKMG